MYVVAFSVASFLYRKQIRERHFPMNDEQLVGLFFWGIIFLLLGARIFATIVYETSDVYRRQPWLVFWPFRNGQYVGLQGMSYHGGVIGGLVAIIIYSTLHRFDYREIGDMFAASAPLGYTFGRLGNFINGELWGRVYTGPWGMLFPQAKPLPVSEAWVQEAARQADITIQNGATLVNLPRHPSQLYEALFEGVILWAFIWFFRNRKPFKGFLIGLYMAGYGLCRFVIEYFREPDAALGYPIQLVKTNLPTAYVHPLLSFSTGQIFSLIMLIAGLVWLFLIAAHLPNRQPVLVYLDSAHTSVATRNVARKPSRSRRRHRKPR
jgi:phosphatidylglycerol:prolipoprotein diacylglycerol transferase